MTKPEGMFDRVRLKKQSQFSKVRIGVSIYTKGYYEEFHALGRRENKANQSQFPRSRPWPRHCYARTNGCGMRISIMA